MSLLPTDEYVAKVTKTEWLNERHLSVTLQLNPDAAFSFVPGQHILLHVQDGVQRNYSITGYDSEENTISITVAVSHSGPGADLLKNLQEGSEVKFTRPVGEFTFKDAQAPEYLFVCTGAGLSPIISMLEHLSSTGSTAVIRLYHGVRHESEIFYENRLQGLKNKLGDFEYKIVISQPKEHWEGLKGYVTDFIDTELNPEVQVYICGHPKMVDDVLNLLTLAGVESSNIIYQKHLQSAFLE